MPQQGLVLYTIEQDGCLNGVYTNEDAGLAGTIYNEIARKNIERTKEKQPNNAAVNIIAGEYDSSWFDPGNTIVNGTLVIKEDPKSVFTFT